ncbi:HAD-IA family hydrolase [Pelagibacterium montanilacus]|uniref:HAD-IA family hydrolase n=1 Tax=Pelagibacterium montanilacus TaxID=2185280 RepID=UPI000F8F6333|nr:HAD-IA family hydrolase [Pelagibacterium montanilacus]
MAPYAALIFDLDGTLVDSAPDITAAVNVCFAARGWPQLDVRYVERYIGNGSRRLIGDILEDQGLPASPETITEVARAYIAQYSEHPAEKSTLFPNVREDLEGFRNAGIRLGICTNKPHALTGRVLEALKLSDLFEAYVGADAVPASKPDPGHLLAVAEKMDLGESAWAYVGDTGIDKRTAVGAKVPFFVVPWGTGPLVEVEDRQRLTRLADLLTLAGKHKAQPA